MIKNFMVSSKDLSKIVNRGCRICKKNEFVSYSFKGYAVCNNCGAKYFPVSEGTFDELEKTENSFVIYRSANIDNPGDEYVVDTRKGPVSLRKAKKSLK